MSLPEVLVAISGLSVHDTLPYTCTGAVHVAPWSSDLVNTAEKPSCRSPFMNTE